MQKEVLLKRVVKKLKIVTIRQVQDQCPIESEIFKNFNFEYCLRCPFLVEEESCGWYEYVTKVLWSKSEMEDLESPVDYSWGIACANCGYEIIFYSGYSHLVRGNEEKCPQCGLLHVFIRYGKGDEVVFAIPIKQWDEKHRVNKKN